VLFVLLGVEIAALIRRLDAIAALLDLDAQERQNRAEPKGDGVAKGG
jgi:hypothetical protein